MTETLDPKDVTVVLAAHGSPKTEGQPSRLSAHVERLKAQGVYADVRLGFLEQTPRIADVVADIASRHVVVVPFMACNGYIAGVKLPKALSLTGPKTDVIADGARKTIHLAEPVGENPKIAELIQARILTMLSDRDLLPEAASVFLVGHGSQKSKQSFQQTQNIAQAMRTPDFKPDVIVAYLEEKPFVQDWVGKSRSGTIVFMPFLFTEGPHTTQDIPEAIGLDPDALDLSQGVYGPVDLDGRRVFYLAPIGDSLDTVALIEASVRHVLEHA